MKRSDINQILANAKAVMAQKQFILPPWGHASAAYLGFWKNSELIYIYEALEDREIFLATRVTMLQSAKILMAHYPGELTFSQLEMHINDLLERFQNKAMGDAIFRVGCDLCRKLSPEDRLSGPIHTAISLGKSNDKILKVMKPLNSFGQKMKMESLIHQILNSLKIQNWELNTFWGMHAS
jgi:mannitol-1-phosphate 5-dehydrogenase